MIPNEVFQHVMTAQYYNSGASLTRGCKTYDLKTEFHGDHLQVITTLFIEVESLEVLKIYSQNGYKTVKGNPAGRFYPARPNLAWREIPQSHVPESIADEWRMWDEY